MKADQFVKSIYLGDRRCKIISYDSTKKRVYIQIDLISRIRDRSGEWRFYDKEDIADGYIVFTGVDHFSLDPPKMPNDYIEFSEISLKEHGTSEKYLFKILAGFVDEEGNSHDVTVTIGAGGVHLENPRDPGVEIKD